MNTELAQKRKRGRPRKTDAKIVRKAKRGRKKTFTKTICDLNKIETMTLKSEKITNKSIIVFLKFDIRDFESTTEKVYEKDFLQYDQSSFLQDLNKEPEGFVIGDDDLMKLTDLDIENVIISDDEKKYDYIDNKQNINKKVSNIMMEFADFDKKSFFRTNVCCWHCCHSFTDTPVGIPLSYENGIFNVKGVFCSFNCASTYNFNDRLSESEIQERESLMHLMYRKTHDVKEVDIKKAPAKECLKMFGGLLEIEEFRTNTMTYDLVFPPALCIIPQLEEIKFLGKSSNKSNIFKNSSSLLGTPQVSGTKDKKSMNTLNKLFARGKK